MTPPKRSAIAAGHICLDVIPQYDHLAPGQFAQLFRPGQTVDTGPATFSTGGPVSNTGLALHRLGISTQLMGKIGSDRFGQIVLQLVQSVDSDLAHGLVCDPNSFTSYSIIISPPATDRIFLHCTGANDTFCAADISLEAVAGVALFHFGYPPLMRRMYSDHGQELTEVFRRAKSTGVTTSLDTAFPDPSSAAAHANWHAILSRALPLVDLFFPSFEEIMLMLHRAEYEGMAHIAADGSASILEQVTAQRLSRLGEELLALGAKIVVIKLGHRGLYLRSAGEEKLRRMGHATPLKPDEWANCELWVPGFCVEVVGTTGAGDATIAGFLSAFLRDFDPLRAVTVAAAVGACNVEAADALTGLRSWQDTLARIDDGWARLPLQIDTVGWQYNAVACAWFGAFHLKARAD